MVENSFTEFHNILERDFYGKSNYTSLQNLKWNQTELGQLGLLNVGNLMSNGNEKLSDSLKEIFETDKKSLKQAVYFLR